MPILSVVVAAVCGLLWLALVATTATLHQSDAAGNGLSYSFAMLEAMALWVLLAVLVLLVAGRAAMPGWAKLTAIVLLPLSGAATLATIELLARQPEVGRWPMVVPAFIPAMILAYALWATSPALRAAIAPAAVHRTVWGMVLLLSLIPWPLRRATARRVATTEAEREAAGRAREDSAGRALEARLQALGRETPLRDWLAFATEGNDLRERTLAGIRALPNRQRDAEALRGDDQAMLMSELRNLGLAATPALCRSSNEFLVAHAQSFRPKAATMARYEIESSALERYLFAMQWLAAQQCNLTPTIDAYEDVVRRFPDSPERSAFLNALKGLRR